MSARLVTPAVSASASSAAAADLGGDAPPPEKQGDNYSARVAKYIPGEVLAAYIASMGIVSTMEEDMIATTMWVVFAFGLIMTPVYLYILARKKKVPWVMHGVVSAIAFVVWAYALGGPFKQVEGLYQAQIGSLLLIGFTLIAGALHPKPLEA